MYSTGVSLSAHLTRSNALSFSPSGLSLLKRLAEVTDQVRVRLRRLLDDRDAPHAFGALFPGPSTVSARIETLGAQTDVREFEKLAHLSEAEQARILELEMQIAQLKSQDIPSRTASLRQDAKDLTALLSSLTCSGRLLGEEAVSEVKGLLENLRSTKLDAERSGAEQFNFDLFAQVGSEVWREFVEAAKSLADSEATGGSYPSLGDHCLLCRQPLSYEAVSLIRRLWEFLASNATTRFEAAQRACGTRIQELERSSLPYFAEESGARRMLDRVASDLALAVQREVIALLARKSELISSLQTGDLQPLTVLVGSDKERLAVIAESREVEAAALEREDVRSKLRELDNELTELQHRHILSEQLPAIKAYVETKRWVLRGRQGLRSNNLHPQGAPGCPTPLRAGPARGWL